MNRRDRGRGERKGFGSDGVENIGQLFDQLILVAGQDWFTGSVVGTGQAVFGHTGERVATAWNAVADDVGFDLFGGGVTGKHFDRVAGGTDRQGIAGTAGFITVGQEDHVFRPAFPVEVENFGVGYPFVVPQLEVFHRVQQGGRTKRYERAAALRAGIGIGDINVIVEVGGISRRRNHQVVAQPQLAVVGTGQVRGQGFVVEIGSEAEIGLVSRCRRDVGSQVFPNREVVVVVVPIPGNEIPAVERIGARRHRSTSDVERTTRIAEPGPLEGVGPPGIVEVMTGRLASHIGNRVVRRDVVIPVVVFFEARAGFCGIERFAEIEESLAGHGVTFDAVAPGNVFVDQQIFDHLVVGNGGGIRSVRTLRIRGDVFAVDDVEFDEDAVFGQIVLGAVGLPVDPIGTVRTVGIRPRREGLRRSDVGADVKARFLTTVFAHLGDIPQTIHFPAIAQIGRMFGRAADEVIVIVPGIG